MKKKSHSRGRLRAKVQEQRGRQGVGFSRKPQGAKSRKSCEVGSRKISGEFPKPLTWDITEVPSEEHEEGVPSYDVEDWGKKQFVEKATERRYITKVIVAIWFCFAVICVARFAFTGDGSSLIAPVLVSGPLSVVLKFYYG